MSHRWLAAIMATVLLGIPAGFALSVDSPEASERQQTDASSEDEEPQDDYYELLKVFVDTLDQVERNYVKDLSRRDLLEAAIEGMISKLDQHSDYIGPQELAQFREEVESEYGGVGIEVTKPRDAALVITSPLAGGPAYRAGILAGDVITHIEDEPTEPMSSSDAAKRIRGRLGTSVELTIKQAKDNSSRKVKLTRELVRIETVQGDARLRKEDGSWDFMFDKQEKIGYVRLTVFARHTVAQLRKAIRQLEKDGMRGLVLDLRSNPGGLLSAAIHVSDLFVAKGRIVSTEGRNTQPQTWDAHRRGTFAEFPMAVLVNRFSASASEIVAACLQDHQRAAIVGERTFGKGSVLNIIELENGRSALKLTTAGYKRPSGKNIHRFPGVGESEDWGVRPDDGLAIKLSIEERRQLAIRRRQQESDPEEEQPLELAELDPVLAKGLAHLKTQISAESSADEAQ